MRKWIAASLLGLLGLGAAVLARPLPKVTDTPPGSVSPDRGTIHPEAGTIEMNHGHATDDVYVLLHGLTNSPLQFRDFGRLLYNQGANVFIPRMPFHGHLDRMTDAHKFFSGQVMVDEVNRAIDHAKTLGRRVKVAGLSVNGISAAWVAQNRSDVDTVMVMAPPFAPRGLPDFLISPLARVLCHFPNVFVWWAPRLGERLGEGTITYPRFSTHALGGSIALGLQVFQEAQKAPPLAPRIIMVTSAKDLAVSNARVDELTRIWQASAPGRVTAYEFPPDWNVPHDWMDPLQPDQQVEKVYPVLMKLLSAP